MLKKTSHVVVLILVVVGIIAVYHMVAQHGMGGNLMPSGLGTK